MVPELRSVLRWSASCCRLLLIGGVLLAVGAYLYVALARLRYPFELEWMEGQSLVQVDRILTGQPLYDRPALDYVPFIYPPLYYYLAAAVGVVVHGFVPLRLVSIVASLGCFALVFLLVRRDTGDTFAATVAVGLFAAMYRLAGAWFDVGRVDTLLLLFLLAGMILLRRETRHAAAGASICFALAFLTKQTAWIAFLPPLAYALWRDWRRASLFGGAALAVAAGASLVLDLLSHGWYRFYVFTLPSHHAATISLAGIARFWVPGLLPALAIAVALAFCAFLPIRGAAAPRAGRLFHASMALGFLGLSWASWLNSGSYNNVLLPACAVVAILAGLGLRRASEAAKVAGA
jgi:4-amino-4-deoxy-L-arabinose transferase-like glycosyltransferase